MRSLLLLNGVQGSGKTTVANLLGERYGIPINDMGTLLFNLLSTRFGIHTRDQLRTVPRSVLNKTFSLILAQLIQSKGSQTEILVTHMLPRRQADTYFPQDFEIGRGGLKGITNLIAEPEEIMQHRAKDTSRKRAPADVRLLQSEQRRYLLAAMETANVLDIPCWIVSNPNGEAMQAAETIARLCRI